MARRIGLSVYTVKMKLRYKQEEWARMDHGGAFDGFSHLESAFKAFKGRLVKLVDLLEDVPDPDDPNKETRTVGITELQIDTTGLTIAGLAECGEYGSESKIYDVNNGEKPRYKSA